MLTQRIGMYDLTEQMAAQLQRPLLRRGLLCDVLDQPGSLAAYCKDVRPVAVILGAGDGAETRAWVRRIRSEGFDGPIITLHDNQVRSAAVENLVCGIDDTLPLSMPVDLMLDRLDLVLHSGPDSGPAPALSSQLYPALTQTEIDILGTLSAAQPRVMSREDIMWAVKRRRIEPDDRTLDVYICNIRRKIRLTGAQINIETVRGRGFRYQEGGANN